MQSGDDFAFGGYQRDLPPHLSHSAPAPQVRTPAMLCLNHKSALIVPNAIEKCGLAACGGCASPATMCPEACTCGHCTARNLSMAPRSYKRLDHNRTIWWGRCRGGRCETRTYRPAWRGSARKCSGPTTTCGIWWRSPPWTCAPTRCALCTHSYLYMIVLQGAARGGCGRWLQQSHVLHVTQSAG